MDFPSKWFCRVKDSSGKLWTVTSYGNDVGAAKINGKRQATRLLKDRVEVMWVKPYIK